jgi:hypothetical protein
MERSSLSAAAIIAAFPSATRDGFARPPHMDRRTVLKSVTAGVTSEGSVAATTSCTNVGSEIALELSVRPILTSGQQGPADPNMHTSRKICGYVLLTLVFATFGPRMSNGAVPSDSGHITVAPIPVSQDTSMLTGSGLNTKPWPIDRAVSGGVMRKVPGRRDWEFIRGVPDAQITRASKNTQAELLRLHGNEPRDIQIAIPDSAAMRKLSRFGITATCAGRW